MTVLSVAETADLVHGVTMADIDRAARVAARKHQHGQTLLDSEDREDTAWHGIVEYVYECGCGRGHCNRAEAVKFYDMVIAGLQAIDIACRARRQTYGMGNNGAERPAFMKYWLPVRRSETHGYDFTDRICELMALRSALGVLTPLEYEAIATLAAHGSLVRAAEALGVGIGTYQSRVKEARKRIAKVWYEDETPPKPKMDGTTCRVGHSRAEYGRLQKRGVWMCRKCQTLNARRYRARTAA